MPTRVLASLTREPRPPAKLTCVVAPTGYGKTVLSTAVFKHCAVHGVQGYWIPLDDRDTSVERVLGRLETGLGNPGGEVHPTQALIHGDEPLESRIEELLDVVAQLPDPSLVFIDNLGYCPDETLGYLLDRLAFRTPASVSFMFSSTHQIPLNSARAKLEGRLREVGIAELSLGEDEVRAFFGAELCAQIGAAGVDSVLRQTEGWPAAVRLAQIILTGAEQPRDALARFSGADEDLSDLLNRQVLAGFSSATRLFLLQIASLRTFCVDLCLHATGDKEAAQHLALLLRRNVFVIPLDRNRNWYRLHGLFREFLIEESQRTLSAAQRSVVLERAAGWCERGGLWQDAIDYALAAGSKSLASAVLERVAPMFVRERGDLRQYIEWIEKLHGEGHEVGWEADFWYVWALVFHRRYDTARQQNERLARRLERGFMPGNDSAQLADLQRRVEVIRTCLDTYTDRVADALRNATAWLAERGADHPFDVATVATAAGISLATSHRFVEARQAMRTAQAAIAQADTAYGLGWVSLISAMIPVFEGDYAAAYNDLRVAQARARGTLGEGGGIVATIALVSAKCAVELDHGEDARALIAQGLRWAPTHGIVDTAALGLDAAVKLWSGRDDDAISISQLREIASGYPPRLGVMLSCFIVQRLQRLGRLDDALAEAAQINLGSNGVVKRGAPIEGLEIPRTRELYAAAEIDLLVAAGQLRQAEIRVAEETLIARDCGSVARQVELALIEAALAVCSHHPQTATGHLARAINLSAKRSILRPFRDRREMIAGLVNETRPQSWGFALEEERRFFLELCRGLPLTNAVWLDQSEALQGAEGRLLETPTARELELLGLIEAGLSNQQLADRLSVSVATVKWHLYNLYAKLGVSSRSAALARARALNLLTR